MATTSLNTKTLAKTAIQELMNAYNETTSLPAKQAIAAAYTAITLIKFVSGRGELCNCTTDVTGNVNPGDFCTGLYNHLQTGR